VRVLHAAGWSVVSSLPQPLVALPAFAFVAFFEGLVPLRARLRRWGDALDGRRPGRPGRPTSKFPTGGRGALVGSTLALLVLEALLLA